MSANSAFSNALSLSAAVCLNKAKEHAGRNKIEIGLNIWTKSQRKNTQSYQHSSNYLLLCSAETSKQVWNDMRLSKWWQNFHFWVDYAFKLETNCLDVLYVSITAPEIVFDISQSLPWLICALTLARTSEIRVRRSHTDRQKIPTVLWGKTNWKGCLHDAAADGHVHTHTEELQPVSHECVLVCLKHNWDGEPWAAEYVCMSKRDQVKDIDKP